MIEAKVFPPQGLLLLAIVAIQLGAALSTKLFPVLGIEGTVAVRIIFSALLLSLATGNKIRVLPQVFARNWLLLVCFGISLAAMNYCFYQAIGRIPLGAAVAIEFIGPLGVAALSSRRASHFVWVALAALGIFLLSPMSGADLDPYGVLFALLAGAGWAAFIGFAGRIGSKVPGNDGLVIGMIVAAFIMIPFAIPIASSLLVDPMVLLISVAVALLATTIPFTLEFKVLNRISARSYGVLMSIEPAVAAVVGALLLSEQIGIQGTIAVACIVIAAIGITVSDGRSPVESSES